MSSTELHTGTLTPVKTINSHQGFIDFVYENELTGYLASSIEIYLYDDGITDVTSEKSPMLLCASNDMNGLPKYCFYKNVIYRFDNYVAEECCYGNKFIRNSDSSINFVSMFYNGGTNFYEELQDGLDALLNKENKYECR